MDGSSSELSRLWDDLGSEAEALPEGDKPAPPKAPFKRRVSLTDKAVAACLSGGLPIYFFLCLGTVIGLPALTPSKAFSPTGLDGLAVSPPLAMLFLLPVAWLASGWLRADKATGPRLITIALLAGGLGQIVTAVPLFLFSFVLNRQADLWGLARSLPPLLENYLSVSTWSLTAAAAFAVVVLLKRLRRSYPWVETSRRSSSWRLTAAALLFSLPWLLLVGAAIAEGRIAPKTMEWRASVETTPLPNAEAVRKLPSVTKVAKSVSRKTRKGPDNGLPRDTWIVTDVPSTEMAASRLLANLDQRLEGDALYELLNIMQALTEKSEELRDPKLLGWQIVDTFTKQRPSYYFSIPQEALANLVLSNLCRETLSVSELDQQLAKLDSLESTLLDPKQELDALVMFEYRQSGRTPAGRRPFQAFGFDLPFSVEGALEEKHMASRLGLWMSVREELQWESAQALETSAREAMRSRLPLSVTSGEQKSTPAENVIIRAMDRCSTLKLRPYLQTIRAALALRRYKATTGHYPPSLETVAASLGEASVANFHYELRGERAVLSHTGALNLKARSSSWTLY